MAAAEAALPDELVEEALFRLPAHEPACLVRAALVCKRWCRIVSDPGFRRRYRAFHRAPPATGSVHNTVDGDGDTYVARFTPRGPAAFPPRADRRGKAALDCRHGRVLLRDMPAVGDDLNLAYVHVLYVWDPVADEQREVPLPPLYPLKFYDLVVLCAAMDGTCDHLDCHGGPFRIVMVGTDLHDIFVYAYSSEAAAWSEPSTIHLSTALNSARMLRPGLIAGHVIYFIAEDGHRIFKYDLVGHVISPEINPPSSLLTNGDVALVAAKDGGLGVANVEGYDLHLWSWSVAASSNGIEQWVKDQIIRLDTVLSVTGGPSAKFNVIGFGEGTDIIFVSANAGLFAVWRKSGQVMKVDERRPVLASFLLPMFCYQSIYTPELAAPPCMNFPPSQSTDISTKNKRKGDNLSSGKLVRGKKRAGVKEKTEKAKKLKQELPLHGPAMGIRSKTADLNSTAMSTRSKTKLNR